MHGADDFLRNLALILGVAALTTIVFQRLHQPVVFGYMLAGMIVGPHLPIPLVADETMVHTLSELGVVLLMFYLGLEFRPRRLLRMGPTSAMVAVLETSLMMGIGTMVGRLFGWTVLESVFAGAVIAISSTTIIVKAFEERKVQGRFTEVVFGVLVFEDLIAIVLLAVLTAASSGRGLGPGELLITIGRLAAFLVALLVVGMLTVPRLIRFVVRLGRPETTLVSSIGLCFACALLARSFGYSVALGAFIAGSLVAESGEARAVEKLVEPVRDMFVAIFFVSVGMLIDPRLVLEHLPAVLTFTLLVLVGKVVAVSISAFLTGRDVRTSVQAGMSLAQIGEFSLIIAGLGIATGATREFLHPVAATVSALTALTTPWLIRAAGPTAAAIDRGLPRPLQTFAALYGSWIEGLRSRPELPLEQKRTRRALSVLLIDTAVLAAIVVGFALESGHARGWLERRTGLVWPASALVVVAAAVLLAAPFAVGVLRTARGLGQALSVRAFPPPDAGRLDLAAAPRRALIVTLQLLMALVIGGPLVAMTQPFVPSPWGMVALLGVLVALGAAFWRSAANLHGHARAGAEVIVAALARQADGGAPGPEALEQTYDLLPGLGHPLPVRLDASSPAAGRRLAELEIRGRTGATVLAITRGDRVVLLPDGAEVLLAGDVLALAGTRESVSAAHEMLGATPAPEAN